MLLAVEQIRKASGTPSLACGVLHDGEVVFSHGSGLADVDRNVPAGEDTVYAIASCTKAFTTASCGILVDEGTLSWTEPVQSCLPEFQTSQDLEVGKRATLLDLCSHGTGITPVDHLVCGFYDKFWVSGHDQVLGHRTSSSRGMTHKKYASPSGSLKTSHRE